MQDVSGCKKARLMARRSRSCCRSADHLQKSIEDVAFDVPSVVRDLETLARTASNPVIAVAPAITKSTRSFWQNEHITNVSAGTRNPVILRSPVRQESSFISFVFLARLVADEYYRRPFSFCARGRESAPGTWNARRRHKHLPDTWPSD